MQNHAPLMEQKCLPQTIAITPAEAAEFQVHVPSWEIDGPADHLQIVRQFAFKNYHETLAFINAIAYVIHAEDHHPELVVTYSKCSVRFDTHTVNSGKGGLSMNDFICAAKIDAIYQQSFA